MKSTEYSSFRRKLNRWYAAQARDLPWRRTTDPYQIWISEIMLQQTTVVAVIPYFERFLARFPSVAALAEADQNDVLRLWEGLGYYSRARNLHRAAKAIVDQHGGVFPTDLEAIQSLPGIGRYTAGAIASFAYDQPAAIVEANTLRLYCRLLGYADDPRSREGQQVLWDFADAVLPEKRPGQLNQAMMELGATVCSPRDPACETCPVKLHCRAFREGSQATVPRPKTPTIITDVTEVSVAIRDGDQYLLRRRSAKERWAGLWDFVRFEIEHSPAELNLAELALAVRERSGLSVDEITPATELKHGVTRYRIRLICLTANRVKGRLASGEEWKWVSPANFHSFPLSVTARKFAELLLQP